MKTKLTLTIEASLVSEAKMYAEEQGRSLSALIENYLKAVIPKKNSEQEIKVLNQAEMSEALKSLIGSAKLPENFDYKKERGNYLTQKYLSHDE